MANRRAFADGFRHDAKSETRIFRGFVLKFMRGWDKPKPDPPSSNLFTLIGTADSTRAVNKLSPEIGVIKLESNPTKSQNERELVTESRTSLSYERAIAQAFSSTLEFAI